MNLPNTLTLSGDCLTPVLLILLLADGIRSVPVALGLPPWLHFVVVARELPIVAFRLLARRRGRPVDPSPTGKLKTALHVTSLSGVEDVGAVEKVIFAVHGSLRMVRGTPTDHSEGPRRWPKGFFNSPMCSGTGRSRRRPSALRPG